MKAVLLALLVGALAVSSDAAAACQRGIDLGIVVDSSGSVGSQNFEKTTKFIAQLAGSVGISSAGTHMGYITYGTYSYLEFDLKNPKYHNTGELQKYVRDTYYSGGGTRTDRALTLASDKFFTAAGGDRPDKSNVLIVLTDGNTNEGSKPYSDVLKPLQDKGVKVLAIGIGSSISHSELVQIAGGNEENVIEVADFGNLQQHLAQIIKDTCKEINHCAPNSCQHGGKCINEANGYTCTCAAGYKGKNCETSYWIQLNHQGLVCFSAKGKNAGDFYPRHNGFLRAVKLVHRSGWVRCGGWIFRNPNDFNSNWGCHNNPGLPHHRLDVVVTNEANQVQFPLTGVSYKNFLGIKQGLWYNLPGYNENSPFIVLKANFNSPYHINESSKLRIWYGEDLTNWWNHDNAGTVCVDVYGQYA